MQDVGEDQFLVLLFVVEAELDQCRERRVLRGIVATRAHRVIDVRAICKHRLERRARQQAALRPGMLVADAVVVGIEEHPERRIERPIAASCGATTNVSKNHAVCARCHLAGLASGIDCSAQSSAESGAVKDSVRARTSR